MLENITTIFFLYSESRNLGTNGGKYFQTWSQRESRFLKLIITVIVEKYGKEKYVSIYVLKSYFSILHKHT